MLIKSKFLRQSKITKKQRFVIASLWLTVLLLATQLVEAKFRYQMILGFTVITYLSSVFAIWEDISGIEWLMLFILPTSFSTAVSLFYFLLPVRWLTRIPFAVLYGVSIYAIFLSENIFNIAAIRNIQLYLAALAVSSFITIVTFFLFSNIIFAFHFSGVANFFFFFCLCFLAFLLNFWNISLGSYLEKRLIKISFFLSVIVSEIALALSFWPAAPLISAFFLTTVFYLLLGIFQNYLLKKPLGNLLWEYTLFLLTFFILLGKSRWGG